MKNIGVIINPRRHRAEGTLKTIKEEAAAHGFALFAKQPAMAEALEAEWLPIDRFGDQIDVAFAFGGDGTVLYTAQTLLGADVPIVGINLGRLGFLTSVAENEIEKVFKAIAEGTYIRSKRESAVCRLYNDGALLGEMNALNDIVLGWGGSSRIVKLNLFVDGEAVGTFACDGMIVSTPTGSTGHALSNGGPVLHPGICGFGINVICPHTLGSRPLVVPNSVRIVVAIESAVKNLILSVDGQDSHRIGRGGRVEIERSPHDVEFIQLRDYSYFSVLAQKLHWRGAALQET